MTKQSTKHSIEMWLYSLNNCNNDSAYVKIHKAHYLQEEILNISRLEYPKIQLIIVSFF